MQTTIVILLLSMVIAILCDSLGWGILCSRSWVEAKGPPALGQDELSEKQIYAERRRNGQISEITRTLALTTICMFAVLLFGYVDVFSAIQHNRLIQGLIVFGLLYGLIYYPIIGPSRLAKISHPQVRLLSKTGLREYFLPYLIRLPGFIAVSIGIFGLLIIHIIVGIQNDFSTIVKTSNDIHGLISNPEVSLIDHHMMSMRLVGFGDWTSFAAQKYIVISLLLLFFLVFVQSSFLRRVIFEASVNKYKWVFWSVAIASIAFSVVYLPLLYFNLHNDVFDSFQAMVRSIQAATPVPLDEATNLLILEDFILAHDTSWLILGIFSGYGNIAAAITIVGGFLIKKVFLADVSTMVILSLLLPSKVYQRVGNYLSQIGVENVDNQHDQAD